MLYSAGDALNTALVSTYPKTQVGFTWNSIESVKIGTIYLFIEYGDTGIQMRQDGTWNQSQDFSIYVIFRNEEKVKTIYDNYKTLMDIETDIIGRLIASGNAYDFKINRTTTFEAKGLPFNLPLPWYASRIDFTIN